MAHFIVTFRIANEGNDQERYRSFVDAVVNLAGGSTGKVWDETTSFYAFQADYPNGRCCINQPAASCRLAA